MQVFYTVNQGDTLWTISHRWQIPLNSLISANNLTKPYDIVPGQQLSMPPGVTTYTVKTGDSLFTISQKYRIPLDLIIEANAIEYPYVVTTGQIITVPQGVPYYVVRPGDTLFKIAERYNVKTDGLVRPDLIMSANDGLTERITPGMTLKVPYAPPGGEGDIALIVDDEINYYIGIYNTQIGDLRFIARNLVNNMTLLFWSEDQSKIAFISDTGVISIIDVVTRKVSKIDQVSEPFFINWSFDNRRIVYSNGSVIRIYDISSNNYKTIQRTGASYVQWFPDEKELLFESKDNSGISQLYIINTDGSNERQITSNTDFPLNNVRLSPNGEYVLYTSPGVSISEIYTLELNTGKTYKILGGPEAKNYFPAWSPDSNKIAYSSTQFINGRYHSLIRITDAKGEDDSTVAISNCYSTPVAWSSDSTRIAYLSGCREEFAPVEVWSYNIQNSVVSNALSGFIFYTLDWTGN